MPSDDRVGRGPNPADGDGRDGTVRTGLRVSPDDAIGPSGARFSASAGAGPGTRAVREAEGTLRPDNLGGATGDAAAFDERSFVEENDALARDLSRRGRLVPLFIALFALAGFGLVVWYAYSWGVGDVDPAELPVIAAEEGPEKTRPEDPGGLKVPHQDKLVMNEGDEAAGTRVERLLPPPEEPIAIAPPQPPRSAAPGSGDAASESGDGVAPGTRDEAASEPSTASSRAAGTGEAAPPPPPPPTADRQPAASAPAGVDSPQAATPAEPVTPTPAPKPTPPVTAAEPASSSGPAVETAAADPQTAAPGTPEPVTAADGPLFSVQLASLKSREAAETAWRRISEAQAELLADKSPRFEQVDLGARGTFVRVQAGPYLSREAAAEACARLKARQQDCLVVRREP